MEEGKKDESLFSQDWKAVGYSNIERAKRYLESIFRIAPPVLWKDAGGFLASTDKCRGFFPHSYYENNAPIRWRVNAWIDVDIQGLRPIVHLTADDIEKLYNLRYDARLYVSLSFTFNAMGQEFVSRNDAGYRPTLTEGFVDLVNKKTFVDILREGSCLNDQVVFQAINDAVCLSRFLGDELCSFVSDLCEERLDRDSARLFDTACKVQTDLWKGAQQHEQVQRVKENISASLWKLNSIATGLENTKSFAKSKTIKSHREDLQREIEKIRRAILFL